MMSSCALESYKVLYTKTAKWTLVSLHYGIQVQSHKIIKIVGNVVSYYTSV